MKRQRFERDPIGAFRMDTAGVLTAAGQFYRCVGKCGRLRSICVSVSQKAARRRPLRFGRWHHAGPPPSSGSRGPDPSCRIQDEDQGPKRPARPIHEKYGAGNGVIVDMEDFRPWPPDARITGLIAEPHRGRSRRLPGLKGWPMPVMNGTDEVTDRVRDRLGNPSSLSPRNRRGMVFDQVQSGKTATYAGLIRPAAKAVHRGWGATRGTITYLQRGWLRMSDPATGPTVGGARSGAMAILRSHPHDIVESVQVPAHRPMDSFELCVDRAQRRRFWTSPRYLTLRPKP